MGAEMTKGRNMRLLAAATLGIAGIAASAQTADAATAFAINDENGLLRFGPRRPAC